ncbi:hypothetical protein TSAR_003417 [Trichomalopsis sarcophagae]|uniref:Uncharacterized protein n=1 Tax=Trichomalopsis sarcophagae TaxID=543379 RepID=A0A232FHY3_9HYME|nr:hypothetical protein TSAR_003417 [Trichomalopsis sarcophagae]
MTICINWSEYRVLCVCKMQIQKFNYVTDGIRIYNVKESVLGKLLTLGNRLFKTNGTSVVVELNGTSTDDNETLFAISLKDEVFMILKETLTRIKLILFQLKNLKHLILKSKRLEVKVDEEKNYLSIIFLKPYTELKNFKIL